MAKYAGVVVTDAVEPGRFCPCSTTRQDIFIDPAEAGGWASRSSMLWAMPAPNRPLLITTNFSLSYYSVAGEVEASRVPAYILAVDTEGTSVLTAWASDKFNAETITKALKKSELEGKLAPEARLAGLCGRVLGRRRGRVRLVRPNRSERGVGHRQLSRRTMETEMMTWPLFHSFPA